MITRTVVVQWDKETECWRNQQTGVTVTGVAKPGSYEDTFIDSVVPLVPRIEPTPGAMYGYSPHTITRGEVQAMIDDAFKQRVIPEAPPYMMDGRWLVTYEWLRREGDYRQSRIDDLQRQVEQLKARRWWKRW